MNKKTEKKDRATEKKNIFFFFAYKGKRKYTINAKKSSIFEKIFFIDFLRFSLTFRKNYESPFFFGDFDQKL
jgi:hypothetical protein